MSGRRILELAPLALLALAFACLMAGALALGGAEPARALEHSLATFAPLALALLVAAELAPGHWL